MKRLLAILIILSAVYASAQIPAPQIGLSGNIGCQGFPCLNSGTLIMPSDANYAMTARDSSAMFIKVTSAVALTTTHNIIAPAGNFPFTIENATTGGQAIQIIGPSGTGVTIPNGSTATVWSDGTNYTGSGGVLTGPLSGTSATFSGTVAAGTVTVGGGASSATLTVNNSGEVILQGGGGGSMTWPSSAGITVYAGSNAWGTSLAAPAGTIVGTTDTQTLTNKTLDGVTPTTMGYVDPTSSIQTQLNGKQAALNLVQGTYVSGDICTYNSTGTLLNCNTAPSGTGTVTSFSAGALSPLFTTAVATATTTPALSFTLSNAAAYSLLFNNSASSAAPTYVALSSLPVAQFPTLNQSTTGNAATATALAATPTQCTSGQFSTGIAASGNANCSTPTGGGNVSGSGSSVSGNLPQLSNTTTTAITDSGIAATDVTQTTATPAANQIAVYGSTAKTLTPTTTLPTAAEPALTGDVTRVAGTTSTVLVATSNSTLATLSALALPYSQLTGAPTLGTWSVLNYPAWSTGTPFVKMTAAGTFSLDTTAYQPSLSLAAGTYVDGDLCSYTSSGTLLNCNTAPSTATVTSFAAPSASWPTWLTPTVTNSTTTPSLAVAASAIPNSALANPATTVNGQTCTLGSTCTATANTTNAVTFAASGGASPGTTFNGSAAVTVSPATIGAAAALGDCTAETANFNITTTGGCYSITGSTASQTATFTATVVAGTLVKLWNNASASWTVAAAAGPTLTCYSNGTSSCVVPAGGSAAIYTVDGTNLDVFIAAVPPVSVADTNITIGSGVAFSANACSSATGTAGTASTVSMSNLATTMTASFTPNSDVHAVVGWSPASTGQLYFTSWPSAAGTLSYYVCNGTASAVTTGAATTWNVSAK